MAQIKLGGGNSGILKLPNTDESLLRIVKCRKSAECPSCEKRISCGSYCLGLGYFKICLECYEKFLGNFLKSLNEYTAQAKRLLEEIKAQEKMMLKNNILAKVKDKNED